MCLFFDILRLGGQVCFHKKINRDSISEELAISSNISMGYSGDGGGGGGRGGVHFF